MSDVIYPWHTQRFLNLSKRIKGGTLHHAILFMGAPDVGIDVYVEQLAKTLLCEDVDSQYACGKCKGCGLVAAQSHPDLHIILREKTQIGIDLIRQAIAELSNTAQLSGNKVLLIPDAHLMSESASNSLLKTLEEPTNNTFIILTTSEPQRLLATILSRCEKQLLSAPTFEQSINWLSSQSVELPTALALKAFNGSPIAYKDSLQHEQALNYESFKRLVDSIKTNQVSIQKASTDWQANADQMITWLAQYFYACFAEDVNPNRENTSERTPNDEKQHALSAYQLCLEAKQKLRHAGLNKGLMLSVLLEKLRSA